jgi:NADH-quinone oxidoreductase subunit C
MNLIEQMVEKLKVLGGKPGEFKEMVSVTIAKDRLVDAVTLCKAEGFEMLSDIFGIDYLTYPGHQGKRFTVAYNLYSIGGNTRIFLRVNLDDGENLPTITHLWKGASFMEREVYDMFGVTFEGHPDLRKLITPEDLDGHPHRKDFPLGETPTLFGDERFLDPAAFRAGMTGKSGGLTGFTGGARKGVRSERKLQDPTGGET